MKKITILIFTICLYGCSESAGNYACEGKGLTVNKTKAVYGPDEYYFCSQQGNWLFFVSKNALDSCKTKKPTNYLLFDQITYVLRVGWSAPVYGPQEYSQDCKKLK
jgi:hypothetical protein